MILACGWEASAPYLADSILFLLCSCWNLGQIDDLFEDQRRHLADLDPGGLPEVAMDGKAMCLFIPSLENIKLMPWDVGF